MLTTYGPLDLAGPWALQSRMIWSKMDLQYILLKSVLTARWLIAD